MKKLFGKTESKNDTNAKYNYVGKSFVVGKMTVVVEEILAEGEIFSYLFSFLRDNFRSYVPYNEIP